MTTATKRRVPIDGPMRAAVCNWIGEQQAAGAFGDRWDIIRAERLWGALGGHSNATTVGLDLVVLEFCVDLYERYRGPSLAVMPPLALEFMRRCHAHLAPKSGERWTLAAKNVGQLTSEESFYAGVEQEAADKRKQLQYSVASDYREREAVDREREKLKRESEAARKSKTRRKNAKPAAVARARSDRMLPLIATKAWTELAPAPTLLTGKGNRE